jgi:cholesterol transport system auxiliary component
MAYVSRPFEVSYFASHEWADTPSRMLAPLVVQALEACGAFVAVVDSTSPARAEVRLDVDVLSLQHEFLASPSQGRVEMRAQLVDLGSRSVLATETLGAAEPAPSADPYGGVVALNRALAQVLAELGAFAARAAGRSGDAGS